MPWGQRAGKPLLNFHQKTPALPRRWRETWHILDLTCKDLTCKIYPRSNPHGRAPGTVLHHATCHWIPNRKIVPKETHKIQARAWTPDLEQIHAKRLWKLCRIPSISRILISVKLMIYLNLISEIFNFSKMFNEDWAGETSEWRISHF